MTQPPYPPQGQPYPGQYPPVDPDIQQNKVMAVLAYIGILVLVPLFGAKQSRFARYHANQGLVLLICEVAYGIIYSVLSAVLVGGAVAAGSVTGLGGAGIVITLLGLLSIAFLVFAILGIVNAAQGNYKPLPIIGKFNILK
jgi:uncharacterized membrane protein